MNSRYLAAPISVRYYLLTAIDHSSHLLGQYFDFDRNNPSIDDSYIYSVSRFISTFLFFIIIFFYLVVADGFELWVDVIESAIQRSIASAAAGYKSWWIADNPSFDSYANQIQMKFNP